MEEAAHLTGERFAPYRQGPGRTRPPNSISLSRSGQLSVLVALQLPPLLHAGLEYYHRRDGQWAKTARGRKRAPHGHNNNTATLCNLGLYCNIVATLSTTVP